MYGICCSSTRETRWTTSGICRSAEEELGPVFESLSRAYANRVLNASFQYIAVGLTVGACERNYHGAQPHRDIPRHGTRM